jgi:hypothetical protein
VSSEADLRTESQPDHREERMNHGKLPAVHDDDLMEYLRGLGVLSSIERGELQCLICGIDISLENLIAVVPHGGAIRVICDRPSCLLELMRSREERKNG